MALRSAACLHLPSVQYPSWGLGDCCPSACEEGGLLWVVTSFRVSQSHFVILQSSRCNGCPYQLNSALIKKEPEVFVKLLMFRTKLPDLSLWKDLHRSCCALLQRSQSINFSSNWFCIFPGRNVGFNENLENSQCLF